MYIVLFCLRLTLVKVQALNFALKVHQNNKKDNDTISKHFKHKMFLQCVFVLHLCPPCSAVNVCVHLYQEIELQENFR